MNLQQINLILNKDNCNYVILTISDEKGIGYVNLFGKVTEMIDIEKRKQMFSPSYKIFFPFNPNPEDIPPNFVILFE